MENTPHLTLNLSGKVRRVVQDGVAYLVAPASLLKVGVLPGSQGPLMYERGENERTARAWEGVPLLFGHPYDAAGQPISAGDNPDVVKKKGLGTVRNTGWDGKTRAAS